MDTPERNPPQFIDAPQSSPVGESSLSYTKIFLIITAVMFVITATLLGYIFSERILESVGIDRRELASHIDSMLALGILKNDEKQQEEELYLRITPTPAPTLFPSITTSPTQVPISPTNTPVPENTSTPIPTHTPTKIPKVLPTAIPQTKTPNFEGIEYKHQVVTTERGSFNVKIITADLTRVNLVVDSANSSDCDNNCPAKSLSDFIRDNNAIAGINGTFFCPPDYLECAGKINSYDFTIYNSRNKVWINKSNVYWKDRAIFYKTKNRLGFNKESNKTLRSVRTSNGHSIDQFVYIEYINDPVESAIVNWPGLLYGGSVIVNDYPITEKMRARSTKMGIGYAGNTVMLVAAHGVSMEEFAYVFKALGATGALNLDSGGSAAMWYNGYKIGPGRLLPNAIVITRK